MTETATEVDLDKFHGRQWMSDRIRKSEDWIAHSLAHIPHVKIGKDVWFTERHARAFIEAHEVKPALGRTPASRGASKRGGQR